MLSKKKYICDTNVLVSGILFKNSIPTKIIDFILESGDLCFSQSTLLEFEEVIKRDEFSKTQSLEKRTNAFEAIKLFSKFIDPLKIVLLSRDEKDNKFLELAVESKADFLITGDKNLLEVDQEKIGKTKILTPSDFIKQI